MKRFI